ncbi:MAG: hypothetical protein IPK50_13930 [Fibrobacterota bacterium]|nr:MAG: hypothetical protein IPK50_13930 [Fibrobacterota bacterium]
MKINDSVNIVEPNASIVSVFEDILQKLQLPWSTVRDERQQTTDFLVDGARILLSYKQRVHPADVPGLLFSMKVRIHQAGQPAYGVIAADFISESTRERIKASGLGTLDRSGNCSLHFARTIVEIQGKPNLFKTPKETTSLFTPKAQRVLRALLSPPLRSWTGTELANSCDVSPGWVTEIRKALFAQEWAKGDRNSIVVSEPRRLLQAWASEDKWKQRTEVKEFSSILSKELICKKLAGEFPNGTLAFTRWVAASLRRPVTETSLVTAYLQDLPTLEFLRSELGARPVERNGNLQLVIPSDSGVFLALQEVDGLPLVCDAQIWLDLQSAGNRAEEQAQALWEWDEFGGWNL